MKKEKYTVGVSQRVLAGSATIALSQSTEGPLLLKDDYPRRYPSRLPRPESRIYSLSDLEILTTIGTGTFGRVVLSRHAETRKYYALKMMAISEVIRLKQVTTIKGEI